MIKLHAMLRQPLSYFVLVGVVVFLVDNWLRRSVNAVEVSPTVNTEVAMELERLLARPPTAAEVEQGVKEWVDTELLFREASALGLQDNDAVIRAHLATKLKHLVKQRVFVASPSDEELRAELAAHSARYTSPETFSVTHVFINASTSDNVETRVAEALSKLEAGSDPATVGDHFPRGPHFAELPAANLDRVLGASVSQELTRERIHRWQRFRSRRGVHLVRLDAIVSGAPTFERVKPQLAAAVEEHKREAAVRTFIDELRQKYSVEGAASP